MVCKKCGMELIEGIDICPYCGEDNNVSDNKIEKENDFNDIINTLDGLRMEESNTVIAEKEDTNSEQKEKEILESIDEVVPFEIKNNIEEDEKNIESSSSLNEVDNNISDTKPITLPNIDDYLNRNFNEGESKLINKENTISDISDTLNKDNATEDLKNDSEKELTKPESIDIENIINQVKQLDNKINNDITNETETNEEKYPEINIVDNKDILESQKEITDDTNIQEHTENNDIANNISQNNINIDNLISDIKNIPVEETTESNEVTPVSIPQVNNNINSFMDDIKSVEVDGIASLEEPKEDIKEEKPEENSSPIKNDYLITGNFGDIKSDELQNEASMDNIDGKENSKSIDENTEIKNNDIIINEESIKQDETQIEENKNESDILRLQENELRTNENEEVKQDVYINPNLENFESPKVPDIPVVLPPKEEYNLPLTNEVTQQATTETQDIQNTISQNQVVNSNQSEKMPPESKKSGNSMMVMLFILMIVLGVVVALVVSYIFNM